MAFGHNDHSAADTHSAGTTKPSIGQKIGGAVDSLIGKATHNPVKVAEGETKKTGDPAHGIAAGENMRAENIERVAERRKDDEPNTVGDPRYHNTNAGLAGTTAAGYDNNATGTTTGAYGTGNQYGSGVTGAGNEHNTLGRDHNVAPVHGVQSQTSGVYSTTGVAYTDNTPRFEGETTHGIGRSEQRGYDNNNAGLVGERGYEGTNTGAGIRGHHDSRQHGYENDKPGVGEKISGGLQSMVGKATHNPEKVAEGEAKKTHDYEHAQNEAAEVRRDNLDRDRHDNNNNTLGRDHNQAAVYDNQAGAGAYGAGNTQAGGAYGAGNTQDGGAYGSGATGGAYDNNAGTRY